MSVTHGQNMGFNLLCISKFMLGNPFTHLGEKYVENVYFDWFTGEHF